MQRRSGQHAPARDLAAARNITFAALLKQHRLAAALSQEALAERAGLSVRAISDLERGVHRTPHLDTVRLLARALRLAGGSRADLIGAAIHERLATTDPSSDEPAHQPQTVPVPEPGPSRLPTPVTSLIGRSQEAAEVVDLLGRADVRLVTLTGVGGVGKTRLALDVAKTTARATATSVACVGLASVREPGLVLPTIAQTLGLRIEGRRTAEDALVTWLGDRQVLLVLDNFEQVLGAGPALIGSCPPVRAARCWSRAALPCASLASTSTARRHSRCPHRSAVRDHAEPPRQARPCALRAAASSSAPLRVGLPSRSQRRAPAVVQISGAWTAATGTGAGGGTHWRAAGR